MIEVEGLAKTYKFRASPFAIDHISFSVPRRSRFGVLGANGAGKSTLLRILATVEPPTEGTVRMGGHDAFQEPTEVRSLLGYMPAETDAGGWRSGGEYLHFWARVSGIPSNSRSERIRTVVDFLELGAEIEGDPTAYTVDVEKRLSLAQALLTNPEVLLLDEPLTAASVPTRQFIIDRLDRLSREGKTIVLSSPFLDHVRAACDQVAVMSEGRLTRLFALDELLAKIGEGKDARVFIDTNALAPEAAAALRGVKGVVDVKSTPTTTIVYVTPAEVQMEAIRTVLEAHGIPTRGMREAELRLGDVFSALNA